jgi:colicin import membrane protein
MIKKIQLPKVAKKHPIAFWMAVILHIALVIGIVFSNTQRWDIPQKEAKPITKPVIKAFTINSAEVAKERQRIVNNKKKRIANEKKRLADLRRAEKKIEKERYKEQQNLKRIKNEIKKEKQVKAKAKKDRKIAEKETKQILKERKLEEEKARKAKNKTREAEKKTKAEEEKERKAKKKTREAEKKTNEAKKKAKLAEQEKNKIEKLRKLEAKIFAKEQGKRSLKKELQAEEDQEREIAQEDIIKALKISWINQISAKIRNNWRNNFSAKDDWSCDVDMLQNRKGEVLSVNVYSCNVDNNDKAEPFKNSIEKAVNRSTPLPLAPDKSIFDKEILFHFRVN